MSSSSTSQSRKQSSSVLIAPSNNCDGVSPSSFWAEVERNREAVLRPQFGSGPFQSEDSFMSSCWSSNADAEVGSGINGYDENIAKWNTNHQSLSRANPTNSFNLFDVPFIDNNGRNDVVPPIQPFDNANNGVYIGNQYVPDFDLGIANVEEDNTYTDEYTINGSLCHQRAVDVILINFALDDFIWNAGFCQRLNDQQRMISTIGYAAEAVIPNFGMPSTSEASNVDRHRTQWPFGQMGGRFPQNTQPSTSENTPSGLYSHSDIDNDENVNVTSPRKNRYSKKPLPSKKLYTIDNGKYICRYKGPAKPEGCSIKSGNMRYLCRHLRIHALKEREMDITQEERVACNGMPEELLYIEVCCPFKKVADQRKCRFFRETGTIWRVGALDRWESVMARHKAEYHDTGDE